MHTSETELKVCTVKVDEKEAQDAIVMSAREDAMRVNRKVGPMLSIKPDGYRGFVVTFAKVEP